MPSETAASSISAEVSRYSEYRARVAGTTIDERTLLSTDYFNSFNEVVMLLGMVGDMPEVLEDIRAWTFRSYEQHFRESGLDFGGLAIEAYAHAPPDVRSRFEALIKELCQTIEDACTTLGPIAEDPDRRRLAHLATNYARKLQNLIEAGSGIIHGADMQMDQSAIDNLF